MKDPYAMLASRLSALAKICISESLRIRGVTDIDTCHGDILAALYERGPMRVVDLAAATGRTKSTASVLVDRLAAAGYLAKRTSGRDARALEVALTEKGEGLRPVFGDVSRELNSRLLAGFSRGEAVMLEELLRKAVSNLK